MCNLIHTPSAEEFEQYMRQLDQVLHWQEPDWDTKPVGPFGLAPFVVAEGDALRLKVGQWGMIRPGQPERIGYTRPKPVPGKKAPAPKPLSTNNARIESVDQKPTFAHAWRKAQRCLVPAVWYAEPNWETGKCIWWHLTRADRAPWMLAGLWSEWTDPQTGELVPNFTVLTRNCDFHPLLGRLHKPERDPKTGEPLPLEKQDKRSLVHIAPPDWSQWLRGSEGDARALLQLQPPEAFDQSDALRTDAALAASHGTGTASLF